MVWLERSTADLGSEGQMTAITQARFPSDAKARKAIPVATGCVDYFPDALAAVAEPRVSATTSIIPASRCIGTVRSRPTRPNLLMRHFVDRGTVDSDGVRHSAKVAWRALALLQKEMREPRRTHRRRLKPCCAAASLSSPCSLSLPMSVPCRWQSRSAGLKTSWPSLRRVAVAASNAGKLNSASPRMGPATYIFTGCPPLQNVVFIFSHLTTRVASLYCLVTTKQRRFGE